MSRDEIDQLVNATRPWDAAAHYGFDWPPDKTSGEVRLTCPFNELCHDSDYGHLSVNVDKSYSPIYCHSCHIRGNLLTLMFGMKHGRAPEGNRLAGDDFKEMVADLKTIQGETASPSPTAAPLHSSPSANAPAEPPSPASLPNVPLKDAAEERVRTLVHLGEQGTIDESHMRPAAAVYRRQRAYMTDEVLAKWGVTYLPPDQKSTLRGRWIYPVLSLRGEVLAWAGRDPEYETKLRKHQAKGNPDKGRPIKTRFPSSDYFRKGQEFFGQHASRLEKPWAAESLQKYGLIIVEGFNDAIRLDCGELLAIGLMGKAATDEQVRKAIDWGTRLAGGKITVWGDNDAEGVRGVKETVYTMSQHLPVLQAWSPDAFDGRFRGRQPESLSDEELSEVTSSIEERWRRFKPV